MRIIGNAGKAREVQAVASGVLSTGDTVIVNSDGTVSVVAISSASQALGSNTVFESASTDYISSSYDANAQKLVLVYRDRGNSDYGTAIVGTVSGTSISFGSSVVFNSAEARHITTTYDANAQKHVIAYRNEGNSSRGTAIVGTVSGTSISFGTPVVFDSAGYSDFYSSTYDSNAQKVILVFRDAGGTNRGYAYVCTVSGTNISFGSVGTYTTNSTRYMSATFDSSSNKVVIAYNDNGNSQKGTAVVGTVSGTSISFGTPVVFEEGLTVYIGATFDSNSNKVVISYKDEGNSNRGTAIVGTVSGTSISFGTSVVFQSSSTNWTSVAYDAAAQKVVISYQDQTDPKYGKLIVGTVSGTSISFGSAVTFVSSSEISYTSTTYDSNAQKVVVSYRNPGNSDYGTSVVFQAAYSNTNLTSENYIGTAASGAPSGQGAKINIKGAVDENQSGLTAGQSYYVQTDGALGTTPADPSVFAGTAVAATKLIVKG